jgi:hypothetical protein
MKKLLFTLLIPILLTGCVNRLPKTRTLEEVKDSKGTVRRLVVVVNIPEKKRTIFVIARMDSNGNSINQYGSNLEGLKYKTINSYDNKNRLTEQSTYAFKEKFENYKSKIDDYELKDTLADFTISEDKLWSKFIYEYHDNINKVREIQYSTIADSLTHQEKLTLTLDTLR